MGGRREVSITFYRPVTRSDLKQERSFFRGSVSSFLQLVVATSSLKVVSNVQDITITRHTKHLKTYTHHKKRRKHIDGKKKEEKTVIIVHDNMIKIK